MNALRKLVTVAVFSTPGLALAQSTPPATLADLTGGISFTTAAAAVLAVALVVIGFKVVKQGANIVLGMIGKAR